MNRKEGFDDFSTYLRSLDTRERNRADYYAGMAAITNRNLTRSLGVHIKDMRAFKRYLGAGSETFRVESTWGEN